MTMDMRRFQVLFDSHNRNESMTLKDPNILAAEKAGMMSSMGYYEKEFTVYGSCFYKDGKRQYIISSKAEKIIDFLEDEKNKAFFPTPLEHWTTSALVPSGTEDSIVRTVKKQFARKLAQQYPVEYFITVQDLFNVSENDAAEQLLYNWQEELEGVYDENLLQLFEKALLHARNKRLLTELSYYKMQQWVNRVRQDMIDDVIKKSTYMRTVYGYSYMKANGEYGYYMNVRKDSAYDYQQRQISKGIITAPIISKTYGFKENVSPQQVKTKFEAELPKIYTKEYWEIWSHIRQITSPILEGKNCEMLEKQFKDKYGEATANAFRKLCFSLDVLR